MRQAQEDARSGSQADPQGPNANFRVAPPAIALPVGGGAIRSIGEKFTANPSRGTGNVSLPLPAPPGRSGFGPTLSLTYDSGFGNGPFGMGWSLSTSSISRKTDKGIPQYRDAEESDVYLISGAEDLVVVRQQDGTVFEDHRDGHTIRRYRPRIEGAFGRIERWTNDTTGETHWRTISAANVTAVYGSSEESRIADPENPSQVFTWLFSESWDDKGNAIVFRYQAESSDEVESAAHERNRTAKGRAANRYVKRIFYGNRVSRLVEPDLAKASWLFEILFDYDEGHFEALPDVGGSSFARASEPREHTPSVRPDPFSRHRSGFEVRTYRRCARVLVFHHFDALGPDPYLVSSAEFDYDDLDYSQPVDVLDELKHLGSTRLASVLRSVTFSGYIRDHATPPLVRQTAKYYRYSRKSLPPAEFEYSRAAIHDEVEVLGETSKQNVPIGLDGTHYRWVDLDGEGLSGLLTVQGDTWYYKRNVSPWPPAGGGTAPDDGAVHLTPIEEVQRIPYPGALSAGQQLIDLAQDGQMDLVSFDSFTPGFFERTADENWKPMRPFRSLPNINWRDRNLRFVDLTGDGLPDVLITEQDVLTWHESLGEDGFAPAEKVRRAIDEERGPRVLLSDETQSIYLADMSGDGLMDLVRIRNGEVSHWSNLGHGRFGPRVSMDNAPWFDNPDQFDQRRIRLADTDGSGLTDIIYLGSDGVRIYFNQCGNRWSDPRRLNAFPHVDDLTAVGVADLLGNGTACLVWSSTLAADKGAPLRYVRLMGEKAGLLTRALNNCGGETRVQYAPSTRFYLQDKAAGKPWISKLPFVLHLVEQVESLDHIARTRFTTRYAYHHGYFDGEEREFRGFGMVEQFDTEAHEDYAIGVARIEGGQELAPEFYQPPVTSRFWFHTGRYGDGRDVLHPLREEYYLGHQLLPGAVLPAGLDAAELRECIRALKGSALRQEVYSADGSPAADRPYLIGETTYEVRRIQPRGPGKHAVFLPLSPESVSVYYERDLADPRVTHGLNLEMDEIGRVHKSATVAYGRAVADATLPAAVRVEQQRPRITYTEVDYTPDIDRTIPAPAYRLRVAFESRSYEITGIAPAGPLFQRTEISALIAGAASIDYETVANDIAPQKRMVAQARSVFLDDNLAPLPLGSHDYLGLVSQNFRLAFTPALAAELAPKVAGADLTAAGYVHFGGDANWWIPSGTSIYAPNAAQHFYLAGGTRDALGLETISTRDKYDLLTESVQVQQAAWTVTTAVNDYRVLGPVMLIDPNKNRSAVEIDQLGMVVKTAVMGKAGSADGDTLADPTMRMEYVLDNWMKNGKPNFVHTYVRIEHGATNPGWRESYSYAAGAGGIAMVKAQAPPGTALRINADGSVTEVDADPRWVGNGRIVLNNKGNPVKRYEPYFSTTHEYEDSDAVQKLGVTAVLYYDAMGRNIRTVHPNGTLARVEFTPWMQKAFDANDTVKESQWYIDRGSPDPAVDPEPADPETRAAWLTAKHAGTAAIVHMDSLGRAVYAVNDLGGGVTSAARNQADMTGRYVKVFDQRDREVSNAFTGMAGIPIWSESAERGKRWGFQNVLGMALRSWDEFGKEFRVEYDVLHRPLSSFVTEPGKAEVLFQYLVYGDRKPNAQNLNLLGVTHLLFDQAGEIRVPECDFKGQAKRSERILAKDYDKPIDWSAVAAAAPFDAIEPAAAPALQTAEVFASSASFDALGRPTQAVLADGTVVLPTYNEGGFLSRLRAQIRGAGPIQEILRSQDFDAKGQRQFVHHGNDILTRYFYDAQTFRLTELLAYPAAAANPATQAIQDLKYTYDPCGNITQVRDDAQQTYFFANAVVRPEWKYEYDPLYQLVRATGREHALATNDAIRDHRDIPVVAQLPHPNDAQAVRNYTEEYEYDRLGNLTLLRHRFRNMATVATSWVRHYHYTYQDNPADRTNRLKSTSAPGDADAGPYTSTYDYDSYGNMTRMPHLARLDWSFSDQLRQVDLGGGGTAWYVYGAGGGRVRKVIERDAATQLEWIFLGAVVLFRRRRRATRVIELERSTVRLADGPGTVAQIDTKTIDLNGDDPVNPLGVPLIRYQHSNHLGSAGIETDEDGNVISYEEYHPYGTTAYRSSKPGVDLSLKRYRFSEKEEDEETGFYYFGARYYAPWLGRWTSTDPAGFVRGFNLFRYCANNPVMMRDGSGMDENQWRSDWTSIGTEVDPVTNTRIDTAEEFERWAVRHGIQYEGTPNLVGNTWQVERWRQVDPGAGGAAPPPGGPTPGEGTTSNVGQNVVRTNPEGEIKEVAPNFDDDKIAAYRDRIQNDRGVAIRGREPGSTRRTTQIRAQNQNLRDAYEASLPGGQRPAGTDIDHVVELQDIGQYNNTVRPQDHRPQNSSLNSSQGSSQRAVNQRRIQQGIPEDVPSGAVARGTEINAPEIQPGFRGVMRGLGYGLMVLGPALTLYGSSQVENTAVRDTGYGLGTAEGLGGAAYIIGRTVLGGGPGGTATGLRVMGIGGAVARVAGGGAAIVLGTYSLVNDIQHENYGVTLGDAATIVAGGAVLAGSAPVAAGATGVALANTAGDWVERKVTPGYGRTAGVTAGTLAGAATGAAVGAAIGVWFGGVGAVPGALIGGGIGLAAGAISGFIGAYW